ncbi:hypothetical protein BDN72DRAFT_960743 [Pluteus cervinus]|uniref:Uncharacterized protein n=1 Tax=Pluteus cervinus TaxID=181527 RepID=A0ACD3AS76_9AGAR|nr:hypothetical protein BDN72DRAFT_960743 [Pluteus cervinus]
MSTSVHIPPILLKTFQYNPDYILPVDEDEDERQPSNSLPFNFYDRHLSPELLLASVVVQPSLLTTVTENIDVTLGESSGIVPIPLTMLTAGDIVFPTFTKQVHGRATPTNLATRYHFTLGHVTPAFISRWVLHPTASKYHSMLIFSDLGGNALDDRDCIYSHKSLRFQPFQDHDPEVLSLISDQLKDALRSLEGKDLIIYQFYATSPAMDQIFRDMDVLADKLPFASYQTGGLFEAKTERQPPCDATNAPWTLPDGTWLNELRYSTLQSTQERVVPRPDTSPDKMDSQTAAGLIYHAWHRAVTRDATIIVFHCGNYERIGIRHRATQTLILSDLIEVSKCQDPGYGKIHVGLMLAAVQDALDRHGQSYKPRPPCLPLQGEERQGTAPTQPRRSKRQRVKAQMTSLTTKNIQPVKDDKIFWNVFFKCSVALVSLEFDVLRSPSPAACLRRGGPLSPYGVKSGTKAWRKSYQPFECCTLTLDSDLSSGGTGRVHTARLEVRTKDGTSRSQDVIVKSAVHPRSRKRVRREYNAYRRLWEHKVDRIPMVYGLFEDVDDLVTLLVIEKFGMSFRDREPTDLEGEGMMLSVTRTERSICLKTVRAMHKAGLAHLDLRAENIMVGHDGLPVIIDFDRSWMGPEKWVTDKEVEYFQEVLDGKTRDEFPIGFDSDAE